MTTRSHITLDGHEIAYDDPSPEVGAFLDRITAMVEDPRFSEDDLIEFIYGKDNPVLDCDVFEDRGAVTREVLANPIYNVMVDLLARKAAKNGRLNVEDSNAAATMTVTQAAAEIGITPAGVRKAIASHRLAAVKRGKAYFIRPHDVEVFRRVSVPRGAKKAPALDVCVGSHDGLAMHIKAPSFDVTSKGEGQTMAVVERFKRVAIKLTDKTGSRPSAKLLILVPAERRNEIVHGPFYVRGRFSVVDTATRRQNVQVRFKAFDPDGGPMLAIPADVLDELGHASSAAALAKHALRLMADGTQVNPADKDTRRALEALAKHGEVVKLSSGAYKRA